MNLKIYPPDLHTKKNIVTNRRTGGRCATIRFLSFPRAGTGTWLKTTEIPFNPVILQGLFSLTVFPKGET